MSPALAEGLPIPTRGIEDYFFTQGVLGIFVLILGLVGYLLYRELKTARTEQLAKAEATLEKYATTVERSAAVQERMAGAIEERNRTTQLLADSLKEFAGSFAHSTEMNKMFLKQALDKLNSVAVLQDTEMKVIVAMGDSIRALTQPDQRKVIGKIES